MMDAHATILVIDDDQTILESITDYLEDRNYHVITATNGQIGLERLAADQPDLVMTDLRMPEVDGIEVLRRAAEISPNTPLIVVSGTGNIGDSVRALRLGAWDYILKPIEDMSILIHAMDKAFERVRLLRENQAYQENLEMLVRKRTKELENANANLANINFRLRNIVDTTRRLSVHDNVIQFGSALLAEFAKHMLATGGSLFLMEENGLRLLNTLDNRDIPDFIPFPLPEDSVLHYVLNDKKPVIVNDITKEQMFKANGWMGYKDGSALLFPLPDETGLVAGILTLHNKISPPFVEQDKEIGALLASSSCETLRAVRSTESLRISEERYRMLFEKSTDAIFIVSSPTGRYLDGNEAALKLTGRTRQELRQLTISDITPDEAPDHLKKIHRDLKAYDLGKITYLRPDGEKRVAKVNSFPLDDNIAIFISRDITDELAMEAQLAQAQKMEAVGRLAGGVAHDLNNLLTPIMGYSQMLLDDLAVKDARRDYMDEILQAGFRARDLVRQLLAFSRKQTLEFIPVDINRTIADFEKLLHRTIPEDITIKFTPCPEIKPVMADVGQIEQVILNLAVNAADAMPNGGKLSIETGMVEIDEEHEAYQKDSIINTCIQLTVKDTGAGMDEETCDHIFEPFFSTKGEQGTGLGLSTVYGIVKQHGGNIRVQSVLNQGTTFSVYLPATDKTEFEGKVEKNASPSPKGTEIILLVEDNNQVRDMTKAMLEKQGYTVLTAPKGSAALEMLTRSPGPVDLLLTDVVMPDMNGKELFSRASEIQPGLKVLYMSGYTDNIIAHRGVLNKGIHFIHKPFAVQALITKIREALGQC